MSFYTEINTQEEYDTFTSVSESDTDTHSHTHTHTDTICVVDFYAPWCGPCKKLTTELEKMVKSNDKINKYEHKIHFIKVNVDNFPDLAEKFNIDSIPFVCFYKNGKLSSTKVTNANVSLIINHLIKLMES
jgi:thioredoxin 1